ncbi:fibronectin type III domain-containing protein [Pontiella sulfatireligans]|uniref:Fibronectin type-III domain-containing protein n=1 Tax=Pontiella sulfatireligans TaxID=2750658 RepID=A0A6C2UF34_9BACT|nr:hypothetical protein [Pontiella sulfatireligans]VGO18031.1 hypothetical protein SCARR_00081 [Pontiella sulfatireligans]
MKRTIVTLLVAAGMVSASLAVPIIGTDFTSPYTSADLAGQQGWSALPLTGTQAFKVDATAGVADTAPYAGSFDTTNGNAVVLAGTFGNAIDDEWTGSMDFKVATSASGTIATNIIGTVTNIGDVALFGSANDFYQIGLTAVATNGLATGDSNDVMLDFRIKSAAQMQVTINKYGNYSTLAEFTSDELGWDPEFTSTNSVAPDFETDDLRLTWTLRKTRTPDTYSAVAVLSNLTTGAFSVYDDAGNINYAAGRSNLYASATAQLAMQHGPDADDDGTASLVNIAIDSLTVDQTSGNLPVLESSVLSGAGGDGLVDLSWTPVIDASSYTLKRGSAPGGPYSTTVATTNGTRFTDTGLVNETLYYYIVTASSAGVADADSNEVIGEPQSAQTGDIFGWDFTAIEGYTESDLDGQKRWKAQAATGPNAFTVTDAANEGYADTTAATFDTDLGNGVYYNTIMSNNVADEWSGTFSFALSTGPTAGQSVTRTNDVYDATGTNVIGETIDTYDITGMTFNEILHFGVTAPENKDNRLNNNGSTSVGLNLRTTASDGNLAIRLNNGDTIASLTAVQMGWDPDWTDSTNTNGPDFETDEITLEWRMRKSSGGVYMATAEMTCISSITGTTNTSSEGWGTTTAATDAYASDLAIFGMTHQGDADKGKDLDGNAQVISPILVSVNYASLLKSDNVPPEMFVPELTAASLDGTSIEASWNAVSEAVSYALWYSDVDGGPYTLLGSNLVDRVLTNSPLTNLRTYFHVLQAYYGEFGFGPMSAQAIARPLAQVSTGWGESADMLTELNQNLDVANTTVGTIYNRVGNGPGGALVYDGWSDYDVLVAPPVYGVFQVDISGDTSLNFAFSVMNKDDQPFDYIIVRRKLPGSQGTAFLYTELSASADATSQTYGLEAEFATHKWSGTVTEGLHLAVRNGTQWYVSETSVSPGNAVALAGGAVCTIPDLVAENWVAYTPATSTSASLANVVGATFDVAGTVLNNITAIGVLGEGELSLGIQRWSLSTGQQPTALQSWADTQGIYNEDAAADADPDMDGVNNLYEWGLAGDPTDPSSTGRDIKYGGMDATGTNMVFIYPRKKDAPKPDYTVLETPYLLYGAAWTDNSSTYVEDLGPNTGSGVFSQYQWVTNAIPTDLDVKFIGLNIQEP